MHGDSIPAGLLTVSNQAAAEWGPYEYRNILDSLRSRGFHVISDPHGTCFRIFQGRRQGLRFREITLHTGLSHGFIYKGYREWIDPIMEWWEGK